MGALLASGEFAAALWPGPNPWDVASLKILLEEAGGKVTDVYGHDQFYNQEINGCVASNDLLHNQLINITTHILK